MSDTAMPESQFSAWVGKSEQHEDVASASTAAGLAAVLDHPVPPAGAAGAALTPLGHWLQFTPTARMSELGPDGHPRLGGFMPPLSLPRRMWAGSRIDYHAPILAGQALKRLTTIESITPKHGASGPLCFVALRHEIAADGIPALTDRQTIVYREAVSIDPAERARQRPPRPSGDAPEGWAWSVARLPVEATLFRYSALTFNTHRIHYDLPYATEVEGYPGLVVHGPLLATYLVDGFLQNHPGAEILTFEFSARAPVFCGEQVHAVGRADGDHAESLAIIAPDGSVAVSAKMTYRERP